MATSNGQGDCDASPKGGMPGFVKVLNDKQLFIPDVAGNKLFHGYGNIETNPKAGFIFFIPGHNQTVRVNGKVRVVDGPELAGHRDWKYITLTKKRKCSKVCCSTSKSLTATVRGH